MNGMMILKCKGQIKISRIKYQGWMRMIVMMPVMMLHQRRGHLILLMIRVEHILTFPSARWCRRWNGNRRDWLDRNRRLTLQVCLERFVSSRAKTIGPCIIKTKVYMMKDQSFTFIWYHFLFRYKWNAKTDLISWKFQYRIIQKFDWDRISCCAPIIKFVWCTHFSFYRTVSFFFDKKPQFNKPDSMRMMYAKVPTRKSSAQLKR